MIRSDIQISKLKMNSSFVMFVTVACLLGLSNGQSNQTCNSGVVTPVQNFTTEEILGKWYIYQFTARLAEDIEPIKYSCLEHEFKRTDSVTFPLVIHETWKNASGEGPSQTLPSYVMMSDDSPAVWKVMGFSGDNIVETNTIFVQTDTNSWAVQYYCAIRENRRWEYMTIITRTRTPSQDLIDVLEVILENLGFPKENAIIVKQSNC